MKKDAGNKCRRDGLLSSAACLAVLLLALLLASPLASAASTNWEVAPSNPYVGNTLVITGTSAPDQTLNAAVSFEKSAGVSGGKYEYVIDKVKIPAADNNRFTVRAERVEDLYVSVIGITLSKDATNGVAEISQSHVLPLTYKVTMGGKALDGQSRVTLRITAAQTIDTDSEGKFRFEYDTDGMPAGEYDITIDGVTKTVTLKTKSSSGGSSSTGSATVRSAEPEEPAPEEVVEEVLEEESEEEESGEDASKAPGNETEEEQPESEPAAEENPEEEEPSADGSFMVWGILGSLLVISLIRKSGK